MSDISKVAFLLKRQYGTTVADVAMRDHPTQTAITKKDGMSGPKASFYYSVKYANAQAIGTTFSTIQTNGAATAGSSGVQFAASRMTMFGLITLTGDAIAACSGDGAMLDLITMEGGGAIEEHGSALSHQMFRDGNGALGRRSSESSDVTTLLTNNDARNFKVGMVLQASANASGSAPRTGSAPVLFVNEDAGTIGLDTSAITNYSDNDYLFRDTTTGANSEIVDGIASIIPVTAPVYLTDSFRGVDRGVHPNLLSGSRVDDTSAPLEDNAGLVCAKIQDATKVRNGFGVICVNTIDFYNFTRRTGAKVEYAGGGDKATVGFAGIDLATPAGIMRVMPDPDCPKGTGYALDLSTWCWKTRYPWVHWIQDDGGKMSLRVYNGDSIEARTRSKGNLICEKPGSNGVFTMQ